MDKLERQQPQDTWIYPSGSWYW